VNGSEGGERRAYDRRDACMRAHKQTRTSRPEERIE